MPAGKFLHGRNKPVVWTGFANVENEPNPPFDVIEREQFRQCDVCGHRDRSVSRQERVNVREEVQAVLRRQDDNGSPAATQEPSNNNDKEREKRQ